MITHMTQISMRYSQLQYATIIFQELHTTLLPLRIAYTDIARKEKQKK